MTDNHEMLSEQIHHKLQEDQGLGAYDLKVRVYQDGVVQVQGIVDVLEEKIRAEQLISSFPEVKKVENDITVCTDGGIDDEDVAFEVSEELRANPEVPDSVGVRVVGGEVQLVGSVSNYNEAEEALETAAKARGVREVSSLLKMAETVDDVTLTDQIQSALTDKLETIPGRIRVRVEDGVVTLTGNTPGEVALEAVNIAGSINGVKRVINQIDPCQPNPADYVKLED